MIFPVGKGHFRSSGTGGVSWFYVFEAFISAHGVFFSILHASKFSGTEHPMLGQLEDMFVNMFQINRSFAFTLRGTLSKIKIPGAGTLESAVKWLKKNKSVHVWV